MPSNRFEDQLRRTLGADLDPRMAAIDIELTEPVESKNELMAMDIATAMELALNHQPVVLLAPIGRWFNASSMRLQCP